MWKNKMGFEASELRIIFIPKKQEFAEAWREWNSEEVQYFCSSPIIYVKPRWEEIIWKI
jgi:hypothetical protein